jgi:hypothetical protein
MTTGIALHARQNLLALNLREETKSMAGFSQRKSEKSKSGRDNMSIIEIFISTPLLVTLQHCWQAFIAIAPAFGLLGLTFLIAKK